EWDKFVMGYYKHPEPQRISETIAAMAGAGQPVPETAIIPTVMFYSYVFAANPSRKAGWEKQIATLNGQTRALMLKSIGSSPESLLATIPPSTGRNDALWACFFATGRPRCLDELIQNLSYMGDRSSERTFYIGFTAKWSLASNMQSHPLVREAIMSAAKTASPAVRTQAASILKMSVHAILEEGSDIIKAQKAAGLW
ncbi:MAG: hypothetical protein ACRD34_11935, partial [Bryobacteraceae bacterium]